MPETILPYDRPVVPQSTGYWCGPASTRIVLQARGIRVPEAELAAEIGTHTGGTDHIGWIVDRSLRKRLPDADYQGVNMPNDPPAQAQRDALWDRLNRSIGAGFGVVQNWVAPPSNYPQGVKGSPNPGYGPGTIFHYVAAMGVDTAGDGAVWIVDPGFRPFEFWVSRRQNESLIPPKMYAWAAASAAAAPPPPGPAPSPPTGAALDLLITAMGAAVPRERYAALLPAVSDALVRCRCDNPNRVSMWMAQIGHESAGLRYMEEIASGAAYEGRADLGNTQPGDGIRFKGRGPIQITGRANYTTLSRWAHDNGLVPSPTFFVDNPTELASDRYGFLGVIWYWTVARPAINEQSDRRDLEAVTRAINGGLNGLADRRQRWERALGMGPVIMEIITGAEEGDGFMTALTPEEQRNLYRWVQILAEERHVSISPFRHLDEQGNKAGAVTMAQRMNFVDGNSHVVFSIMLAAAGDHEHLALLREVASAASDPVRYPDRQDNARLAQLILDYVAETGRPEVAPPAPPAFLCLRSNTNLCGIGGTADNCTATTSGRCIMAELAGLPPL